MVEWTFPRHPRSVGRARVELLRQAYEWSLPDETAETALLLLSELATNACRHTDAPRDRHILVTCAVLDDATLRVEVSDADPRLPDPRDAGPDDESGRGLALVAALATTWGAHPRGPGFVGKTVWFELKA
ncbi:ATP-binding protein [Kitasatospora sp. NPDC056327]|uniref:ATP-binding protein n=1 Tax=Kitasatospora sp. NPDC056327 TaxID=3345785 RepID=UPI0035E256BD